MILTCLTICKYGNGVSWSLESTIYHNTYRALAILLTKVLRLVSEHFMSIKQLLWRWRWRPQIYFELICLLAYFHIFRVHREVKASSHEEQVACLLCVARIMDWIGLSVTS